jgi:ribosomal protein S18 acetylase RimI-like enzyme
MATRKAADADRIDIARIVVNAFWQDFSGITDDRDKMARAVAKIIVPQKFFVACEGNSVLGAAACSDKTGRAMSIHTPDMIRHLGLVRGLLDSPRCRRDFSVPLPYPADTGYIEFVAVTRPARRRGIATALLRFIINHSNHSEYLLDVIDTNAAAIRCYEKIGFVEIDRVRDDLAAKRGYNERIYMGLAADQGGPQRLFANQKAPPIIDC